MSLFGNTIRETWTMIQALRGSRDFDSLPDCSIPYSFKTAFTNYTEKKCRTIRACNMSMEYDELLNALNDWLTQDFNAKNKTEERKRKHDRR